ncbi:Uncharacterised protein [Candidatus Bilamarchaeum dharawalense]|uniref:Uncharacterized protein n=1 Tax=Candidatus Bilamarchaeum dharawalense TaxID=2885759 RepID=A0A5E4LLW7_9ARCH|nr:Uncharacterised protein [Candidatus Bilamarchaeum dharawalense]
MGILDSIVGSAKSAVSTTVSGAVRKAGSEAGSAVSKTIDNQVREAAVNVDAELKKLGFDKQPDGGYKINYEGRQIGALNAREVTNIKLKKRLDAISALYYNLTPMHPSFKNRDLSKKFSEKLVDDMGIKE